MISSESPVGNPYPATIYRADPLLQLDPRRRDEIVARAAFYGEPVFSLAHNTVCDTFEEQMATILLPHLVTVQEAA